MQSVQLSVDRLTDKSDRVVQSWRAHEDDVLLYVKEVIYTIDVKKSLL